MVPASSVFIPVSLHQETKTVSLAIFLLVSSRLATLALAQCFLQLLCLIQYGIQNIDYVLIRNLIVLADFFAAAPSSTVFR